MRIPTKLILAFGAAGLITLFCYDLYVGRGEERNLRGSAESELQVLGCSMRVAMQNALRDGQTADVQTIVDQLGLIDPGLAVFVFGPDRELLVSSQVSATADLPLRDALGRALSTHGVVARFDPPASPERALLAAPLLVDERDLLGGLVIVRPLRDLRARMAAARRFALVPAFFLVVGLSAVGLLIGTTLVGRPLSRIAAALRTVRSGDLSPVLPVSSSDEMGLLTSEFNAMVANLKDAQTQLVKEIEARGRLEGELQRADKLITIGQLSSGLAHEIGSPLQILNGRARALLAKPNEPEQVRRNAEVLVAQTERIARIVDQLLHFARRKPEIIGRIDLIPVVRAVLDLIDYEARRRGLKVAMACPEESLLLDADANQVQQVVLNLLTNALEATPAGGEILVRIERGEMATGEPGKAVSSARLSVTDTGCGIPMEVQGRLFEPFFTTRGDQGGTGLGLCVVKSIVTEHGGLVSVKSEVGLGSQFSVDLPISRIAQRQPEVP